MSLSGLPAFRLLSISVTLGSIPTKTPPKFPCFPKLGMVQMMVGRPMQDLYEHQRQTNLGSVD